MQKRKKIKKFTSVPSEQEIEALILTKKEIAGWLNITRDDLRYRFRRKDFELEERILLSLGLLSYCDRVAEFAKRLRN